MSKPKFIGTVTDMFTGHPITYPTVGRPTPLPYDNIFTRKGSWHYVNSIKEPTASLLQKQNKTVEAEGEHWITLNPLTGEIIHHSPRALEFLPGQKCNGKNSKHRRRA